LPKQIVTTSKLAHKFLLSFLNQFSRYGILEFNVPLDTV